MKHNKLYLSGFISLVAIMACIIPSQTTQLIPTADPNAIGTFIAETAQASAQQTEQANVVPTPTIVPTETQIPTPVVSPQGTSLVTQPDGSIVFTDHKAGIQVTFPAGWLTVRVGEPEYYDAWTRPEASNTEFQQILTGIQDLNPHEFRLEALDLKPEHMPNGDISRIQVVFGESNMQTLEQHKKNQVNNPPPLTGYKLLSADMFQLPQDIQALNVEFKWNYGENQTGYCKKVFIKVPGGSMSVALIISLEQKETIMPDFEQILNSITLFTP